MLDVQAIRAKREELGLSQQQAAELAGFETRQAWSKLESDGEASVTLTTLNRVAAALGVKAKDLLK